MPEQSSLRPAVFLDRDGTIAEEVGYLNHASRFRMFPFVAGGHSPAQRGGAACHRRHQPVRRRPRLLSGIARAHRERSDDPTTCRSGREDRCDLLLPAHLRRKLYLPQAKNRHAGPCRPGTWLSICSAPLLVGDRYGDMELARNARARSILVRTGYGEGELAWHAANWPAQPDFVAEDLAQAADWILRQPK